MGEAEWRAAIRSLGSEIDAHSLAGVQDLFDSEQSAIAAACPAAAADLAYGAHPRQRLDLYAPAAAGGARPIFVWVHGGGFQRGDKGSTERWPNAHAGRFAARAGFLGTVLNYRLAPDHQWPAGGEDIGLAVDWLKANATAFGGDPDRIVLMGTSAGAVHIATYLQLRAGTEEICGAILLSGLYGCAPFTDARDLSYFGGDERLHARRAPLEAVVATRVPLLVACAEFDPPRFQAEFLGLLARRLERHGTLPRSYIASGHNHFSLAYHLGTSDMRLANEIIGFMGEHCQAPE